MSRPRKQTAMCDSRALIEIAELDRHGKPRRITRIKDRAVAKEIARAIGQEIGRAMGKAMAQDVLLQKKLSYLEYKAGRAHDELEGIKRVPPRMLN